MKRLVIGYLLVTLLISIAILYPYSIRIRDTLPNAIDPVLYAWNLMHNYTSATHGFKNLLDTNIFYPEGNTLALSDTLFAQTLLTAPVIALTHNPVLAENLYILATFPLSAAAMFFLCYYLTESCWASMFAGIFYAFSYPRMAQIGHMPAISSQWLPLVFLYLIKWIRNKRLGDLFWLFFWYLTSITSTVYFGIFLIPLSFIITCTEHSQNVRHLFRQFLIILIPAIIVLIIVLFPYIRLRAEYPGIRRSLDDAMRLSAAPKDYLTVLPTSWLADLGFPTDTNERALYPTLTLLVLALLSPRKKRIGFFLLAIAACILSFGPYYGRFRLPYYYLYKMFPLLESIRVPARFSIFVILGLSVSAAYTLSRVFRSRHGAAVGIFILLLFLTETWQTETPNVPVPLWNEAPAVYHFLKQAPDTAIIVELPLHPEWLGTPMDRQLDLTYTQTNENDVYALEAYRTYFSSFHGKRMLNGYSGYFPTVYNDHASVFDKFPTPGAIATLEKRRVRYILVHSDEYVNVPYSDIAQKIREFPQLKLVGQFGDDYLYSL